MQAKTFTKQNRMCKQHHCCLFNNFLTCKVKCSATSQNAHLIEIYRAENQSEVLAFLMSQKRKITEETDQNHAVSQNSVTYKVSLKL